METGIVRGLAAVLVLAPMMGCAAIEDNMQGPLQPQAINGPCDVDRFFLLSLRSVPAKMTIRNTGQACQFVLFNQALNVRLNAALLTGPASHGTASTSLISGGQQAMVSYVPQPGYVGPDKFDVTIQPNAIGVTVNVEVSK